MSNTLVIDRQKWRTGNHGKGRVAFLNDEGFMCCLGFECLRRGLKEQDIINKGEPAETERELTYLSFEEPIGENEIEYHSTKFTNRAITINDDPYMEDDQRERDISLHFSTIGVKVEFINDYPKA